MTNRMSYLNQIERQLDANGNTQYRIELHDMDIRTGFHDAYTNRKRALVASMERTMRQREEKMLNLACLHFTGKYWKAFKASVKGDYRPSVVRSDKDDAAFEIFNQAFKACFGREVYSIK